MRIYKNLFNKGFTLVELLVVIAIIAILFAVILIAINPAQRFKDSRNSRRLSDVKSIVEAATTYTADRRGTQLPDVPDYQCVGSKPAQDFQATTPTGSTAFWRMDEASGALADSAGATSNNIALANIANITYDVSGKFNKAVQMNGSTSSIVASDDAELDPVLSALTLEGWIKLNQKIEPGSFDHHQTLFDKGNYRLQLNSESGKLELDTRNPSGNLTEYNSSTADNTIKGINNFALFQNNLYAGALTNNAISEGRILKQSGAAWSVSHDYSGSVGSVNALTVYNGKLYSGHSQKIATDLAAVYVFDGTNWQDTDLGSQAGTADVLVLTRYKGKLYAGLGSVSGASVWEYDGNSWRISRQALSTEATAVYSFAVFQGKLYAGTGRGATDQDARVFEFDGNSWAQRLSSNDMTTLVTDPNPKDAVYSLTVFNKELYIGLGGNINTDGVIYKWSGTTASQVVGTSLPSGYKVLALTSYNNMLNAAWSGILNTQGKVYYLSGGAWTERVGIAPATEVRVLSNYYGKLYVATRGDATNEAKIGSFGSNGFIESQKSIWYPNIWYHVAGVYSGSTIMNIIINGNIDNNSTTSVPVSIASNTAGVYIGTSRNGDPFYGALDNFAVYNNTALSETDIASHAGCYNLGQYLAPEYMGSLPIDPSSEVTDGTDTGYFISKDTGGVITITAPLTETTSSVPEIIKASR